MSGVRRVRRELDGLNAEIGLRLHSDLTFVPCRVVILEDRVGALGPDVATQRWPDDGPVQIFGGLAAPPLGQVVPDTKLSSLVRFANNPS